MTTELREKLPYDRDSGHHAGRTGNETGRTHGVIRNDQSGGEVSSIAKIFRQR